MSGIGIILYTVYDYTPSRSRVGPDAFMKEFNGYLQADAYAGFTRYTEFTAYKGHFLPFEESGHKSETFIHAITLKKRFSLSY